MVLAERKSRGCGGLGLKPLKIGTGFALCRGRVEDGKIEVLQFVNSRIAVRDLRSFTRSSRRASEGALEEILGSMFGGESFSPLV